MYTEHTRPRGLRMEVLAEVFMTGWLVVNGFLNSSAFEEIYSFLLSAARKREVRLEIKRTTDPDMVGPVGKEFGECPDFPDCILFWDKDINLARRFESEGIPVFNGADAVERSDSKILTSIFLSSCEVRMPETFISPKTFEGVFYSDLSFVDIAAERLGFPMIIKEEYGSFGKQVYLADGIEDARNIIGKFGYKSFIMQKFISDCRGRDLRLNVVGDRVVSCVERYNPNDFRSNLALGGKTKAAEPTKKQKELAISAVRALGLDFAGVDILNSASFGDLVCEVNSNPHFKGAYDCFGINLGEPILDRIINILSCESAGNREKFSRERR